MSYLMTHSVFKSFWFLAQKTLFTTTATPQANVFHKRKFILPKTNFHLFCGKPNTAHQEFLLNTQLFILWSFCILHKIFPLLNIDLVGVFFFLLEDLSTDQKWSKRIHKILSTGLKFSSYGWQMWGWWHEIFFHWWSQHWCSEQKQTTMLGQQPNSVPTLGPVLSVW